MKASSFNTMSPAIPLIVGVTGHRDLRDEDVPTLEARVADVFRSLGDRYPYTPLLVLTPLAEGSDRLVTRVALRLRDEGASNIRIVAPLPMPRSLYEQDFRSADGAESASSGEFRDLLARVDQWFELPLAPGAAERDVAAHGSARDRQYEQLGAFIAAHSQVLLALWDGVPTHKTGATARVVEFALTGLPPEYAPERGPFDQLELGPVYHIVTPRRSNPATHHPAFTVRRLWPRTLSADGGTDDGEGAADHTGGLYERVFQRIETFNRDLGRHQNGLTNELERSRRAVVGDDRDARDAADVRFLLDCYAATDALAAIFRRTTDNTRLALFVLAFGTALSFGVYAHLGHWPPLLLVYGALLALTVSVYLWGAPIEHPRVLRPVLGTAAGRAWWARRGDFQNKAQDYRALAEGLRVQLFWRLAGVPDSVADRYMLKQKSELDWIRVTLRNWTLLADHPPRAEDAGPDGRDAGHLQLVLARWVRPQEAYFRRAARRDRAELRRHTRRAAWALAAGTLSTIALGVSLNFPVPWRAPLTAWLGSGQELGQGVLITGILALLVIAALVYAYADEKVLEDHVKQYLRMQLVFGDAGERLHRMLGSGQAGEARELILSLGREALIENGDWVIAHRSRPLEIHAG